MTDFWDRNPADKTNSISEQPFSKLLDNLDV